MKGFIPPDHLGLASPSIPAKAEPDFLHPAIQHRHDEDRDRREDHASKRRDGHGDHDVRAPARGGQDGHQGQDGRGRGHNRRADAPSRPFQDHDPDGGDGVGLFARLALVQEGGHEHAVVRGDAEEGQKAHPDGHAQVDGVDLEKLAHVHPGQVEIQEPVLSVQPDHGEPSRPGREDAREDHESGRDGPELQIEDDDDQQEGHGQDDHELLLGPDLILVASREFNGHPGRDDQFAVRALLLEVGLGRLHDIHFRIPRLLVEEHVAKQKRVLALDGLGAAHVADLGQLPERDLPAAGGRDGDALQTFDGVAQIAHVAHPDRIHLAAFDGRGRHHAAHGGLDDLLHRCEHDAVARNGLAVRHDLKVRLAHDAVRHHRGRLDHGHFLEQPFHLHGHGLDGRQVRPLDLDPHGRAHARLQHDDARSDGLQLRGRGHAGHFSGPHDLVPDVVGGFHSAPGLAPPVQIRVQRGPPEPEGLAVRVGDEAALFVAFEPAAHQIRHAVGRGHRDAALVAEIVLGVLAPEEAQASALGAQQVFVFIVDDGLDHGHRRRVQGRVRAPELAHGALHFRDGLDGHVLQGQEILDLAQGGVGHGGRHVEEGTLVQRRHELLAQAREGVDESHHWPRRAQPLGQDGQEGGGPEPDHSSKQGQTARNDEKKGFMPEKDFQKRPICKTKGLKKTHQQTDEAEHEKGVGGPSLLQPQRQPVQSQEHCHGQGQPKTRAPTQANLPELGQPVVNQAIDPDHDKTRTDPDGLPDRYHKARGHQRNHQPQGRPHLPAAENERGRCRKDGQGHDDGGDEGEGLGVGQGAEQLALGPGHEEDGQKADDGRAHGREHGAADLGGPLEDHPGHGRVLWRGVHLLQDALADDDAHIDHGPDGDGDARQGHDVGIHPELFHGDEAHHHGHGQERRDEKGAAQVHDQHQDHDDGDQDLLLEGRAERIEGLVDEARAVVEGHNGQLGARAVGQGLLRQTGSDAGDLGLDRVDGRQGVFAVAHGDHAADHLHSALVQQAPAVRRTEADVGHVVHGDGDGVAHLDDRSAHLFEILDEADAADDVLHAVDFHGPGAHLHIGHLQGGDDLRQADARRAHGVGIDLDLVLAHEAAHTGHLAHPLGRGQGVAHVPVLHGADLVGIPAARRPAVWVAALQGVPEDLAQGRGVGAQGRAHVGRQC